MEILYWSLIGLCFVLGFMGLIFPIIPSVFVLWGGFLIYQAALNPDGLSTVFWVVMGTFTVFLTTADFIANRYFVNRFGGSKWGKRMAVLGVLVGAFIMPPFGILFVPFALVYLAEWSQQKTPKEALLVALGSLFGFLGSTAAKLIVQLIMVGWFFADVALG